MSRLLLVVFAVAVAGGLAYLLAPLAERETPPAAAAVDEPPPSPPPPIVIPAPTPPSFDIVRVNPRGGTVMAGRAAPGAEVAILDGNAEIGRVVADSRGEWVFVPAVPLAAGVRHLCLRTAGRDGGTIACEAPVVVVVPAHDSDDGTVIAVKLAPGGSEILQGPDAAPSDEAAVGIASATQLGDDGIFVAGKGIPGSRLNIYLDDRFLDSVLADGSGRWRVAVRVEVPAGVHKLRADQITVDGRVGDRAEVLLDSGGVAALPPGESVVVVQGEDRWRITRRRAADQNESIVIYRSGESQSRDPKIVLPGQVP